MEASQAAIRVESLGNEILSSRDVINEYKDRELTGEDASVILEKLVRVTAAGTRMLNAVLPDR